MEIIVGISFTGLIAMGASQFMASNQSIAKKIDAEDNENQFSKRRYQKKFVTLFGNISLAKRYFKFPILTSNGSIKLCGRDKDDPKSIIQGSCFMAIDDEGLRKPINDSTAKTDDALDLTNNNSTIDWINFYSDQFSQPAGILEPTPTPPFFYMSDFEKMRYSQKARRAKDHRYFAGWSIADKTSPPFYFATRPKNSVPMFTLPLTIAEEDDNDDYKAARGFVFAIIENQDKLANDVLALYRNQLLLFFHAKYKHLHFYSYIDDIKYCNDGRKLEEDECLPALQKFTDNNNKSKTCQEENVLPDPLCSKGSSSDFRYGVQEAIDTGKHVYLLELGDIAAKLKNPVDFFQLDKSGPTWSIWHKQDKLPYFPYKYPNYCDLTTDSNFRSPPPLTIADCTPPESTPQPKNIPHINKTYLHQSDSPLNPHLFYSPSSSSSSPPPLEHPFIGIPVEVSKFTLKNNPNMQSNETTDCWVENENYDDDPNKSSDPDNPKYIKAKHKALFTKQLIQETFGRHSQVLLNQLHEDSYVVFAKQLGNSHLATFIFDDKPCLQDRPSS